MKSNNRFEILIMGSVIAFGIAACGYFIGQTMYNAKVAINTAEAKGLAEKRVEADLAYWTVEYTVTGKNKDEVPNLYKESEEDQEKIVALLLENGFDEDEITPGVIHFSHQDFRDDDNVLVEERYFLVGSIEVSTKKVRLVSRVRSKLNKLIAQGLNIRNNAPSYHFTELNKIKPVMLKEATKNARLAANEFASNAGVQVGGIRSARQGSFIIRDVGENYGDTAKIEKDVRVVTNITFYLTK